MARRLDRHLDPAEIDMLVVRSSVSAQANEVATRDENCQASLHAETCPKCRERVRMHTDMQDVLEGLRMQAARHTLRAQHSSDCPTGFELAAVACGQSEDDATSARILAHAARCDSCGPALKQEMEQLAAEATDEEEAQLQSLPLQSPSWQRETVLKLQASIDAQSRVKTPVSVLEPRQLPRKIFVLTRQALYSAAAIIVLATAWLAVRLLTPPSPSTLIAQAYSEHRIFDLRLRGAQYGAIQVVRGQSASSDFDKPLPLLEAEQQIARKLKEHGNDPNWLRLSAEADMLNGKYESALYSLNRARESDSKSSDLLTDQATAYFMRAEALGSGQDFAKAIDLLSQVLVASPQDPTALYNRAVAEERLYLYHEALADWDKFLTVETSKEWLADGRARRDAVARQIQQHAQSVVRPESDPIQALSFLEARMRGTAPIWSGSLDEAYLEVGLQEWMKVFDPSRSASALSRQELDAKMALELLGKILLKYHNDSWLSDMMSYSGKPHWKQAAQELAAAATANALGEVDTLQRHSTVARKTFALGGNRAGEVMASLQFIIGVNRAEHADNCLNASLAALQQARTDRYPWIEANLMLEQSTCKGSLGDPEQAASFARQAAAIAKESDYDGVYMETLYFLDGVSAPWVASNESWNLFRSDLGLYWASSSSAMYGANFYADMVLDAETDGLWNLAEVAGKESVILHDQAPDLTAAFAAHHYLAQAAQMAGDEQLAYEQYQLASEIQRHSPEYAPIAAAMLEVERASVEIREKRFDVAAERLTNASSSLCGLRSQYSNLPYYRAVGELHLRINQPDLAEAELLHAVEMIEGNSESLSSDPDRLLWHRENGSPYRNLLEIYTRVRNDSAKSFAFQEWYRAAPLRAIKANQEQHRAESSFGCASTQLPARSSTWPFAIARRQPSTWPMDASSDGYKPSPDRAVLSWFSFPQGVAIWLLDTHGVTLRWVNIPADTLRGTIDRFARLCSDPNSDQALLDRDARQLYQWTIAPVRSQLSKVKVLVVESDESLGPIPFQALRDLNGQYLSENFTILDSPGIAYSTRLRIGDLDSKATILAVGNPLQGTSGHNYMPPLPEAETEARGIAGGFDHHFVLTGLDATLPAVKKLLPDADVFHFAGHASWNGPQVGLLLAGGTNDKLPLLDATLLAGENLRRLRLVVLSGCDTARAEDGLVDPANLVGIFLRAGVPHVVATKWQVDSHVTAEMMQAMYVGIKHGQSVASALRSAQEAIRLSPATAHPYFWAAFAHFGA